MLRQALNARNNWDVPKAMETLRDATSGLVSDVGLVVAQALESNETAEPTAYEQEGSLLLQLWATKAYTVDPEAQVDGTAAGIFAVYVETIVEDVVQALGLPANETDRALSPAQKVNLVSHLYHPGNENDTIWTDDFPGGGGGAARMIATHQAFNATMEWWSARAGGTNTSLIATLRWADLHRYTIGGLEVGPIAGSSDCVGITDGQGRRLVVDDSYAISRTAAFRVAYETSRWNDTACISAVGQSIDRSTGISGGYADQAPMFANGTHRTCSFVNTCIETINVQDCNGNGYPDLCDIQEMRSRSFSHRNVDVPDECENNVVCQGEESEAAERRGGHASWIAV